MRRLGLAFVASFLLVACGDGDTTGTGGTGATTSAGGGGNGGTTTSDTGGTAGTGGSTGGTAGEGGTGGTGGATTGGGGTGGRPLPTGVCGRRCKEDVECCPDNQPNCIGPYPNNYKCVDENGNGESTCRPPQCTADADCGAGALKCKSISMAAVKACVLPCQTDGECAGTTSCIGMADDGTKYCSIQPQPFTCTDNGGECDGFGVCAPTGDSCVCMADSQCDDIYYTKDCINVGN
ncbi:MAG: hypothetical protein R3B70_36525 [Polyangiaceae bacterium]